MAHTTRDKEKLQLRVRRIRGQIEGLDRALTSEADCSKVLQQIAACRGAIDGLMAEVLEGHIRSHVADPEAKPSDRARATEDLIELVRSYLT